MVGWHHRLNGHEFEHAPGDGEGPGSLACCSPWGQSRIHLSNWITINASDILMVLYYMTKWEEASLCLQAVLLDFSVLRSGVRLHKNRVFKPQVMIYPAHTDSQPRWGQLLSRLAGRGVASSMTAAHCHCPKSWSPVWLEACHLQVGWDPIFILAAPLREEEAGSHLFFFFFPKWTPAKHILSQLRDDVSARPMLGRILVHVSSLCFPGLAQPGSRSSACLWQPPCPGGGCCVTACGPLPLCLGSMVPFLV